MLVFGTRPEAIKMAPVFSILDADSSVRTMVCVTGQHRQMLDQVLDFFGIVPDEDLQVMSDGQTLADITALVLTRFYSVLKRCNPDFVLVHGDTTTSFAAALACFYAGVKVGHIEAGLRTFDKMAPFPEEYNRQSTGLIADYHFAPTNVSRANLESEGKSNILVTGNTVIDALQMTMRSLSAEPENFRHASVKRSLNEKLSFDWESSKFVLITGHRRENFGEGFANICDAIKDLATTYADAFFVYPLHLNPNVRLPVSDALAGFNNILLIEPLDYPQFVMLMSKCFLVLTDSGGVQEEAPSLGKPVVVMRDTTERPEAVAAGTVVVVGADTNRISAAVKKLFDDPEAYKAMSVAHNPYGDGRAAARIVQHVLEHIGE